MKKIILSFICLLTIACSNSNAQCTPNLSGPSGHIIPDSATNLPHSAVGQIYNTDIQLWVPHDTVAPIVGTVSINYYNLDSITGLPLGFTYSCNPSNCRFPHDAAGCLHLTGTAPTANMVGTYPLHVYITANVTVFTIPTNYPGSLTYYKIVIEPAGMGIPVISSPTQFEVFQNIPNPVNGVSEIDYYTPANAKISFKVVNVLGSIVQNKTFEAKTGINQIYISSKDIAPGVYMYSISNGLQTITKRMVVGNR